jgi:hypothetical protein
VPTAIRKDTGKMNVPSGPGTLRKPPRPEAEAKLLKESTSLLRREAASERKISLCWSLLRIQMDQSLFYWASMSLWSKYSRGSSQ